jgi:hypothetical protein
MVAAVEASPFPRRRALSERRLDVLAVAIVALVFAIPLRGLLRTQGPPMEEGFMLVFPERVLKGAIPNRDFLHLYGPGSLWALAGVFKVFGVSLLTERLFGLVQQLAIVFGVFALARQWGRTVAVAGALTSALVIIPFGLTALAWVGGVGLALCGLALGIHKRTFTAGVLLGLAILFRLDLIVAVALASFALTRGLDRVRVKRLLTGMAAGLAPYVIHVVTAGPGHALKGMVLDPVFHLRGGRSLPVPPRWSQLDGFLQRAGALAQLDWPIPSLARPHQLFLFFFLLLGTIAFLLFAAWRAVRADPAKITARTLLVVALFSLGILPQALQRVDTAHFEWVACVPFGFLPVALFDVARRRWPNVKPVRLAQAAGAATLALVTFVLPAFTVSTWTDYTLQTFGSHRTAYRISHAGRTFYYGKPDRARAAQEVIDATAAITKPGQKLFVGPVNLRKTPYSDAYLYYMLPDLVPGTYYIEMDPGMANTDHSGLDQQLASSDVAILSSIWDNWSEPNDSRKTGSAKARQVLARDFCHVGTYQGLYQLYRKCH